MIDRRPRAPVLRLIARLAMAVSASAVKVSLTPSMSKQPLILLDQRVLGLGQDRDQRILIEIGQCGNHRQTADKFRNQAEFQQVFGLQLAEQFADAAGIRVFHLGAKTDGRPLAALGDDPFQPGEGTAADEQDIRRIHLQEFLLRMLAPALRRHGGHGAFHDLQKRLLHALARHVAGDRGVVGLAGDLVDLVDIDDAALRAFDIVFRCLQQLEDDVFHILADIAGLGQRRRIGHGEGHIEDARQRLRQQRLAATGGADQQDVRLRQFDLGRFEPNGSAACNGCEPRRTARAWRASWPIT